MEHVQDEVKFAFEEVFPPCHGTLPSLSEHFHLSILADNIYVNQTGQR